MRIDIFFKNKKILQIKRNKIISKYKTIHILLTYMHLDCRGGGGGGSSDRNASRDNSVETGDESVVSRDESIEAG